MPDRAVSLAGVQRVVILVVVLSTPAIAGCGLSPDDTASVQSTATRALADDGQMVIVVEVIDGDTMEVRYPDGSHETIRLLGVDTPEARASPEPAEFEGIPDTPAGRQWLGRWGDRASRFARDRLAGTRVRIRIDPRADRRGGYGRLLVYLYHDDQLFNLQLLRQGYARLYESQFTERERFAAAEREARTNDVGLWGYNTPSTTRTNGSTGPIALVAINADAPGNDNENLDEEYVRLRNDANRTLTLTDWTIADAAGHTYTFPDGFTLDQGAIVTVYTGRGSDSASELYWGRTTAVWNNDGDRVTIRNASGVIVVERSY